MANPPESNASPLSDEFPRGNQKIRGDRNQVIEEVIRSTFVNIDHEPINLPDQLPHVLNTSTQISNTLPHGGLNAQMNQYSHQTILFLASNPNGKSEAWRELREIKNGLERSQYRDLFTLKSCIAINHRDVHRSLLNETPQIVHFAANGIEEDGLIFQDDAGNPQLVDGNALAGLFSLFADTVQCVILNGGFSTLQVNAIVQEIRYVIGMNQAIGGKSAIEFSAGFYDALGAGKDVEFAYNLGCKAIAMDGFPNDNLPKLFKHKSIANPKVTYSLTLDASYDACDENQVNEILSDLKKVAGNFELKVKKVVEGSIKLILESSPEGHELLSQRIKSGEISEISGLTVQNLETPNNLPRSGAIGFINRESKLTELAQQLHNDDYSHITSILGMAGVGKTELALQYAIASLSEYSYPGGICWLSSCEQEIATQIVSFAENNLGLFIPDDMETADQVPFTWQRWPEGQTLIVIDGVTDYDAIAPYLPPSNPRFKVLITTRLNLGSSVKAIEIEELSDESAIALLKTIVGDERIEDQFSDAEALCKWVGNLPLGLELLGRFLESKPDWAIAKLIERLESEQLAAKALVDSSSGMTATLGVAAALELSWAELDETEQELACLLGMFAVAPIPWYLVEQCFKDVESDDLEDWRDEGLRDRSLIKRVGDGEYQLHQVVQEFFREKLKAKGEGGEAIKSSFCEVMVAIAKSIDETPTLEKIDEMRGVIAHLEEIATQWLELVADDEKIKPFVGIEYFYQGQGNYELAEPWYQSCLTSLKKLFGQDHPDVASSINNLALLYESQGRYDEAETLFLQALELRKKLFGQDHPDVASSINNLAGLYESQGRYDEAETLFLQALELRKKLLSQDHPDVASSINSLALLYESQGRYDEAETLHLQALELRKKLFGQDHPDVASSINNLAGLYEKSRAL